MADPQNPNPSPSKPQPQQQQDRDFSPLLPLPQTLAPNLMSFDSSVGLSASFKLSSHSYRFHCRHRIHDSFVGRLSAAGRPSSVKEILDFQKQFRDDFKREGFGIRLISLYGKAQMADEAQKTFDELEELGCPRSVKSFNALLTVFAECEDVERVTGAFERVSEAPPRSIVPNGISYNILIKALCDIGLLRRAHLKALY